MNGEVVEMNILILTGRFGFGHYSAATSIKEHILKENPNYNVEILDFIDYMFPFLNKIIYANFNFLVNRCSGVYNVLNSIASKNSTVPLKKVIVKKIDDLLNKYQANMVISVLPVCSEYITAYKKMAHKDIILNTFITDIYANDEWINEGTDKYFVASMETKLQLINKGINDNQIIVSGIPVRSCFKKGVSKETTKKNILIMGGGLGLIPQIDSFLSELNNNNDVFVTVIAGNNKKLYQKLSINFPNIQVLGFTDKVYKYMNKADLIITKAGGVTLFEAINSLTPLFIIKPFLMQEVGNAKYIENNAIGEVVWKNRSDLYYLIMDLLHDEKRLKSMQDNMFEIKKIIKKTTINREIHKEVMSKCSGF